MIIRKQFFLKKVNIVNAVEFDNISKTFPGVRALKNVSFQIEKGTVHALVGENGAGKSTLLNILHGIYPDYEGSVKIFDEPVKYRNPNEAIVQGKIYKVHQETNIIKDRTVGANITLGAEPVRGVFVDTARTNQEVNEILRRLNCTFTAKTMAFRLTAGDCQLVSIAKALYHKARVISLDEPTASLSIQETENLFHVVKELKAEGVTFIYVSHRLKEIFDICDRVTVMRDGELIRTSEVSDVTQADLIHSMVGRNVDTLANRTSFDMETDEEVLKVENFTGLKYRNISFTLHKGEILGFSGLVGAGRTELMRAIVGADRKTKGTLTVHGTQVTIHNTAEALSHGIGMLPEDRKTQGFLNLSTNTDNVAISSLKKYMNGPFVSNWKKVENCVRFIKEMNIMPPRPDFKTANMSGGNQQKVIISRWLSTDVDIIIFDEPTKGVDVGGKAEIYRLIEDAARAGKGIIVVSSELPEIMGISDRIIVMHEGDVTGHIERKDFNEDLIMHYAIGGTDERN